jgi:type IV secretory pathway VirB10-like protein
MDETEDPRGLERQRALMSPAARERRARFAKYVAVAMGVSLVLLAAAVLKTSLPAPPTESTAPKVALGAPAPAPPRAVSPAPEPAAPAPVRAQAPPAQPLPPPTPEVVVEPQPSSSAVAVASPSSAAPAPAASTAGATKEREASRFALERGDLGTAIAAGERAVALDPSDGEAWLVLGAAYQARGELAQAKRCYRACVEQGTRGPKAECRAMAQGE